MKCAHAATSDSIPSSLFGHVIFDLPHLTLNDLLSHPDHWECAICGYEWPKEAAPEQARVVKAAVDTVVLIKT